MRRAAVLLVCAAVAGVGAAPADAIPPKRCGKISHKGKRYLVMQHIVGCRRAKPWARRYLRTRHVPGGFRCGAFTGPRRDIPWVCRDVRRSYRTFWVER